MQKKLDRLPKLPSLILKTTVFVPASGGFNYLLIDKTLKVIILSNSSIIGCVPRLASHFIKKMPEPKIVKLVGQLPNYLIFHHHLLARNFYPTKSIGIFRINLSMF